MMNKNTTTSLLTIDELAAQSAVLLSDVDQASGRVSEVPSRRTIRYYAQHGLLDKPVKFEGRTALYGNRHLLQLVAIKRLQAQGETLADIQSRTAGATNGTLARLAKVEGLSTENGGRTDRTDEAFWTRAPAEVNSQTTEFSTNTEKRTLGGARLATDVFLVLEDLQRSLGEDDIKAIEIAAEPLLKVLRKRHLLNSRPARSHNEKGTP